MLPNPFLKLCYFLKVNTHKATPPFQSLTKAGSPLQAQDLRKHWLMKKRETQAMKS